MNGAQDLGGMMGFGPVVAEKDEPVFHGKWESRVLANVVATQALGWWHDLVSNLKDLVRGTICCKGIPLVDTPKEREALLKKLLVAIKKIIPNWVSLLVGALEKWILEALEGIFKYLVGLVEKLCEGVACPLSPLPIED